MIGARYASAAVVEARSYSRNSGASSCDATTCTPGCRRRSSGRHRLLVRRIAEGEEQTDRDRLRITDIGERVELERFELAGRTDSAADAVTAVERHEWFRMLLAQAIQVRACLAAQVEQMLETRVAHVGRPGAPSLEQRVRRDSHPVREALELGLLCPDRPRGREHRLLLPLCGRHLGRADAPLLDEHRVGEGAADVDAQNRHVRTLHRRWLCAPSSSTSTD